MIRHVFTVAISAFLCLCLSGAVGASYSDHESCIISPGDVTGAPVINVLDAVNLVAIVLGTASSEEMVAAQAPACGDCIDEVASSLHLSFEGASLPACDALPTGR